MPLPVFLENFKVIDQEALPRLLKTESRPVAGRQRTRQMKTTAGCAVSPQFGLPTNGLGAGRPNFYKPGHEVAINWCEGREPAESSSPEPRMAKGDCLKLQYRTTGALFVYNAYCKRKED